ncbi:GTPase ObgE [[Mycoplasma] testudinis]|uniref:GTPase ObgE n=1 Tax=[Mycoplasma] testudinis TaxID=33924 RepID=UPI0004821175|nr:GTPase ObgE [[Mycoplasma] testudinis]
MQFVDNCTLKVAAGNGGNGIVAWMREAHYDKGGPAGGSGGAGGDIIVVADHNESSLMHLKYTKFIKATDGENGKPDVGSGRNGPHKYIKVPVGTTITNLANDEVLIDLIHDGQEFVICHGGKGGRGNAAFKSPTLRAPAMYENGDLGETLDVKLELRYLANVGIVGFPNAGKSTLISKLSNAKPKIANYHFTTLVPVLGTVQYQNKRLIFADVPGLIENAAEGYGLGHHFLRHVERCEVLIHLISLNPFDHDDVIVAYDQIMNELKKYSQLLLNKKMLVVANKNDVPEAQERLKLLKKHLKNVPIISISAITNDLSDLIPTIFRMYEEVQQSHGANKFNNPIDMERLYTYEAEAAQSNDPLNVVRDDMGRWIVSSKKLDYWFRKIPQTTMDNITRLGQKIKSIGVEDQLKAMGAKANDVIVISDYEFLIDE